MYSMRYASWFWMLGWTAFMALLSASGFVLAALGGWGAVLPGLFFGALAGVFALSGWHVLRSLTRSTPDDPEVLSVPEPVNGVLTLRKTPALGLIPVFLFGLFGWGGVALCGGSALGLVSGEGSAVAGLVISGLFVLLAHGALMEHAVTVKLDLRNRRWAVRHGVWPILSRKRGDLTEASRLALAREVRSDEGSEYEVLVARLEWRDGWFAPLILSERPNSVDAMRYGGQTLKIDYHRALVPWASNLAGILNLPLADETKVAHGSEY
jgi:hypothetical protein